ncbi:MAG TPA: DUF2723 domain-containing protein [Polyangia bacterium]
MDTHRTFDPRTWGALLVAVLSFAAYALCSTPAPYFLDSAELAAATFGLGVAHPPGEVTALLWGKFFDLLPLGNVAFRAALSQAFAGALAALLVYALTLDAADWLDPGHSRGESASSARRGPSREGLGTLPGFPCQSRGEGTLPGLTRVLLAAATALMFAFAPGVVVVSNRAEVYALQTALSLAALWLSIRAATSCDARPALVAAVLIGLGVANHSLLAGLTGLGAVFAALPLLVKGRGRLVGLSLLAFAAGMTIHAYLPLRAAALWAAPDHGANAVLWGDARSLRGLWWVVSAHTFAVKQAVVQGQATPWDLPFLPMEELSPLFALLAPAGVYFLLRRARSRPVGLALLVAAAGSMGAALIGGLAPANPDNRGYLGVAFALIAVFSGAAILFGLTATRLARLRPLLAALLLLGAFTRFPHPDQYPGLRTATVADAATGQTLAQLPPRAALFTNHFETAFLVGYQRLVEARRPDVGWAHLAFVGGPGYAERIARAEPDLRPSLDAYRQQAFSVDVLTDLDLHHPVRIEPDIVLPSSLRKQLAPAGDLWALAGDARLRPLPPWMLAAAQADPQARGYLGWRSYIDAVWACNKPATDRVGLRFAELGELMPSDARFKELKARCQPIKSSD